MSDNYTLYVQFLNACDFCFSIIISFLVTVAIVLFICVAVGDLIIQRDVAVKRDNDTVYHSPLFSLTKDRHSPFAPCVVEVERAKENERTLFSKWPRSSGRTRKSTPSRYRIVSWPSIFQSLQHFVRTCLFRTIERVSTRCKSYLH